MKRPRLDNKYKLSKNVRLKYKDWKYDDNDLGIYIKLLDYITPLEIKINLKNKNGSIVFSKTIITYKNDEDRNYIMNVLRMSKWGLQKINL